MGNLTITINDDALRKARIRALQDGTSVNAVLREFLDSYAGASREQRKAADKILAISRNSISRRGEKTWIRDDLHERH